MAAHRLASTTPTSPLRLVREDDAAQEDGFGADEGAVRWDLVARLRFAIESGQYDDESHLDAAIDRLAADLEV